jgi:predicted site-specific integrase-resolvase
MLGISKREVRRYASEGRLTRIVLGEQTVRYRLSDVDALIEDAVVPTQ